MSLLPRQSDAELLRLKAEREGRGKAPPSRVVAPSRTDPAPAGGEAALVLGTRAVRLPWSVLVPDNRKYAPALAGGQPRMVVTARYRTAKASAAAELRRQMAGRPPLEGPCAIRVRVYPPSARATNDVPNMTKLVHDALQGVVVQNDRQLVDVHWTREPADVDAPRAEITVTTLP